VSAADREDRSDYSQTTADDHGGAPPGRIKRSLPLFNVTFLVRHPAAA